jgi:hypothetical protein
MKYLMERKFIAMFVILSINVALALTKTTSEHDYREITFTNTTDNPVEIGYFYKPSKNSPSRFQSSGFVPAKQSTKIAVRINYQMTARTPSTNTQFIASADDKTFKISGGNNSLVVTKVVTTTGMSHFK